MNDDTKKNIAGPLMVKPNSEDRKLSSAAATPPPTKKVIIKSADMLPDMQKEAVDIAVNVSSFSLPPSLSPFLHCCIISCGGFFVGLNVLYSVGLNSCFVRMN